MSLSGDAQLVEAILRGHPARFAEVVHRYDRRVRRVVERSLADPGAQEEIVQQTFYLALRQLHQLSDPRKLESWLVRIASNCVAEHHRRQTARELLVGRLGSRPARAPVSLDWVWDEVRLLAAPFREVLFLRYREGCTYQEMAKRLEVPISTVRGRIYQARLALRRRLSQEDH